MKLATMEKARQIQEKVAKENRKWIEIRKGLRIRHI